MQGRRCDGGDGMSGVECSGRSGRPGHPAVRGVRRIPNSSSLHSPASQSRVLSNIRRRRRTAVFEHLRAHNAPPPWKVRIANPRPHVTDPGRMRVSGRSVINGACAGATSSGAGAGIGRSRPCRPRRSRRKRCWAIRFTDVCDGGRAPGGRTILRRAGMRRGGGPLGVPVAAPRDHDPDARTDGGTHQRRDSELVQRWRGGLNAPTGAWCSLTGISQTAGPITGLSQCTYRCVVLPDVCFGLLHITNIWSQCTYRCVVLPDRWLGQWPSNVRCVSMHLQVRGAP